MLVDDQLAVLRCGIELPYMFKLGLAQAKIVIINDKMVMGSTLFLACRGSLSGNSLVLITPVSSELNKCVLLLQALRVSEGFRLFSTVSCSTIDTSCAAEGL